MGVLRLARLKSFAHGSDSRDSLAARDWPAALADRVHRPATAAGAGRIDRSGHPLGGVRFRYRHSRAAGDRRVAGPANECVAAIAGPARAAGAPVAGRGERHRPGRREPRSAASASAAARSTAAILPEPIRPCSTRPCRPTVGPGSPIDCCRRSAATFRSATWPCAAAALSDWPASIVCCRRLRACRSIPTCSKYDATKRWCGPRWCAPAAIEPSVCQGPAASSAITATTRRTTITATSAGRRPARRQADHQRLRERTQSGHHLLPGHRPHDGRPRRHADEARSRHQRRADADARQPDVSGQPRSARLLAHAFTCTCRRPRAAPSTPASCKRCTASSRSCVMSIIARRSRISSLSTPSAL